MPDALSKTVPIWCVVLNRLLFSGQLATHGLYTPMKSVGASEHAQMDARINGFVQELKLLQLDIPLLRASIKKPLVPSWVTPDFEDVTAGASLADFNQIVCCTASHRVEGTEASENGYIQGAADDHEGWSQGLTPSLFWNYKKELFDISEEAIPDFVRQCIEAEEKRETNNGHAVRIASTNIFIGTLSDVKQLPQYDAIVLISGDMPVPSPASRIEDTKRQTTLQVPCKSGKLGSRALRSQLDRIVAFLAFFFSSENSPDILIACPDGTDLSVGVALAIHCLFYDDRCNSRLTASFTSIDKTLIRRRLAEITAAKPDANPSRATLQSVHAFLMP